MSRRSGKVASSTLGMVAAIVVAAGSRAQAVDLSCMGVQTAAAAVRINALGAAGDAYKPVLEQVRRLQQEATDRVKPIEDDWNNAIKQFHDAHPGISDANAMLSIRQSVEMDAKLARVARGQYEVHVAEANQIVKVYEIPLPDNQRRVDALAGQYVADRQLSTNVYSAVQESSTFRHLISTLAAAYTAQRSPHAIPSAPLAQVGFDTPALEIRVEAAATAAATLIKQTNADQQRAQLAIRHLGAFTGDREVRGATMRDMTKPATREFTAEAGTALNEFVRSREVFERLQHIEIPEKVEQKKLPEAVAEKVQQTVKIIYRYVGGSAPDEQPSKKNP